MFNKKIQKVIEDFVIKICKILPLENEVVRDEVYKILEENLTGEMHSNKSKAFE